MGLIFRTSSIANPGATSVKNAALTYAEGDGNFAWLATNLSGSTVSITGSARVSGSLFIGNSIQMYGAGVIPLSVTPAGTNDSLIIGNLGARSLTEGGLYSGNGDQIIAMADIDNLNYYYSNGYYKFSENSPAKRHELTGSLVVSGSVGINVNSPSYNLDIVGSLRVSSGISIFNGYTQVRNVLNLEPRNPLPAGTLGDLATSGSALWFYDGGSWREVSLL